MCTLPFHLSFKSLRTLPWRAQMKYFGEPLGKWLFYQDLNDPERRLRRFNQWCVESGITAPWMASRAYCQEFWRKQMNESPVGNRPIDYATKSQGIVAFLDAFWREAVRPTAAILEVGCNCGANLEGLRRLGYQRLAGIEINPAAIDELGASFPKLASTATIHQGSLETILPTLPSGGVDAIFSMAVLLHVHPTSKGIFREMIRVSRRYVCTIEAESANCAYVFARDYRRVFTRLGCRELASQTLTPSVLPPSEHNYFGYTARLFAVPPTSNYIQGNK